MKTFRGFELKRDVGLGLQNHYERKNTQEPARFSKWGGFKDLDWDFLDKEFYAKDGKNLTEDQDDIEEDGGDDLGRLCVCNWIEGHFRRCSRLQKTCFRRSAHHCHHQLLPKQDIT